MREILFRGKRKDNGEWVEGAFCQYDCPNPFGKAVEMPSIIKYGEPNSLFWFEVDPETVSQYTGQVDRNGVKIFEGDLLNGFEYPFWNQRHNAHNYFAEVIWFDRCSAFGLLTRKNPLSNVRGISEGNCDYMYEFDSEQWEVIGNIWDSGFQEVEK